MSNIYERVAAAIEGDRDNEIFGAKRADALILTEQGKPKPLLANAITMLRVSPQWDGVIKFDEFAGETIAVVAPPWESNASWKPRQWTSNDDIQTANWLQCSGVDVTVNVASQAITVVADDRKFHPVVEYLDGLSWDQIPRLDKWIAKYFGAVVNPYHSEIGRCSLIAAVARIRQPGCKVDTIPILEGGQGLGKSTALRLLFEPWFSDDLADLGSKDAAMQLRGIWLIEISELDAMSRSDVGRVKAFASRMTDRFRPPYGSRVIDSPRSCVFWGTTNSDAYLKDETGGRRFWPIRTGALDRHGLVSARAQLWAEADARYRAGESWWIRNSEVEKVARNEQQARYIGDPWETMISKFIATRKQTSIDEILTDVIKLDPSRWEQANQNRVARCLKSNGFVRFQLRTGKDRDYAYRRENCPD